MQRNQRLALAVAALAVLVIAFVALRPGDGNSDTTTTTTATTPPTSSTTQAAPTRRPTRPNIPVLVAGKVKTITVKKGGLVRFAARSATPDEIHVHGYDLMKDAPARKTVRMSFRASIDGIFDVEFEKAGEQIAELKVEP
jgi:hypothetical protein